MSESGLSKGRLTQLLDPNQPFGDVAARNLEERLQLEPGYFDSMGAQTLEFALAFDSLTPDLQAKWMELVRLLSPPSTS